MLQETRLNHGSEQETKVTSRDEFYGMNLEQLKAYGRSRGWEIRTWSALTVTVELHADRRLDSC
jgi:hypothetical protein